VGVRGELQLMSQAIRRRWPITEEMRSEATQCAIDMIRTGKPREKVAALRLLKEMEGQNQQDEKNTEQDELRTRLIELAASAGIDRTVLGIGEEA